MDIAIRFVQTLNHCFIGCVLSIVEYFFNKPKSIDDKVVVITGAAQGIAREVAIKLAALRARIAVLDINEEASAEVVATIRNAGGLAYCFRADVTKPHEMRRVAGLIKDHPDLGDVDIVLCSAGVLIPKLVEELTDADVKKTFDVNVLGYYWTIKAFYPAMLDRSTGHIVAISSMGGYFGNSYSSAYSASKFAVRGLMESLEWEIYDRGMTNRIKTTTVYPFFTQTNLLNDCQVQSAILPLLTVQECADGVVNAILYEKSEAFVPTYGRIFCIELKGITSISKRVRFALRDFFDVRYR